jgi:hypothetical protein
VSVTRVVAGLARGVGALVASPRDERGAFAAAWWLLLLTRLRRRVPQPRGGQRVAETRTDPEQLLRVFNRAAAHHVTRFACLPRAMAFSEFLRQHGVPSGLRLGVRKRDDRIEGHAWVEGPGGVIGPGQDFVRTFVALDWAGGAAAREEAR